MVPAALQDVGEAGEVGVHVGHGVLDGVAHPGLGGQIDHPLGLVRPEGGGDALPVLDVQAQVGEAGMRQGAGQAGLLEAHVVIVVEVVDADDLVTPFEQAQGEGGTDEAGAAGDEYFHEWAS